MLQGYWIYFEELNKGTLQRRISLFDSIHQLINGNEKLATNRFIKLINPVVLEEKDRNS